MPIHTLQLGFWEVRSFALFGQVPFLALMILLYFAGRRRGWPWRSALLATTALAGGLSLGAAMLPSVVGAVAGGIALWLLAQRLLGLRTPPYAALAVGLAGLVAVGRWGCLLNGCCFGRVSHLPWAMAYGAGSAPWLLHRSLGEISTTAASSLPVHPYPVYESCGLLLWIPVAIVLHRRLRSEASLLLFTLAYDLGLRAAIDGTRAMINVWWALLGARAGLDLFQWGLAAAALAALLAGLVSQRRAPAWAKVAVEPAREAAPLAGWAVFVGIWLVGWLTDASQTIFLHRVLVGALALSAVALRMPLRLPVPRPALAWATPTVAAGLALLLGWRVQQGTAAEATSARRPDATRGWLYDVDHRRHVIVRVGTVQEPEELVNERRAALDLPATDVEESVRTPVAPPRAGRTWVGGGVLAGGAHYRVGESCSNDYTLYDRQAGGGWLEAQHETAATPTSVWWLGGRGLALYETATKTVHTGSSGTDVIDNYTMQTYAGQFWVEWEHPNISVGAGGLLGLRHTNADGDGSALRLVGRPSLHLRAGLSFLGVDGGIYDRGSLVGPGAAHLGVSGAIGRGVTRIRHPDDTVVRYFLGALAFPGADPDQTRLMLGAGLEIFATPRLVLGLQGAGGDGGFGLGYVRAAVGP